ncbi:acyl-CoA dehydrogenase family protein [Pseudokineococcus marinus]|uniref:Acyl-CoA dehydrogenase n=1 Tax=Pseudokineococcus marinus TaxID=351215 RepID=A0A849BHC9_9ACTN|nr:acyl-CoA dehydrogenase family protein [Pseudokineococcus marinus]NNH22530.1 acyl-CoA dehydrogenase [Pseudokineococcus marinus]
MSTRDPRPPLTPDLLAADFLGYQQLLTDDERALVVRAREFYAAEVAPGANQRWLDEEVPRHLAPRFAEEGLLGLGVDGDEPARRTLLTGWLRMELARVDPSTATFVGVHDGLVMGTLAVCGSEEQKAHWLPRMRRAEAVGAFALTEPDHGSDVAGGLATSARRDGDAWVLDGAKRWIGNACFADVVVVWARDVADGQVKGFLVEKGTPGFTATPIRGKTALRAVENADITLEGCRVPAANHLAGANSFKDTNEVLRRTRGGVAWEAVGVSVGAYEHALAYTRERQQFGRPLASFQLVQDHLVRMLSDITASLGMVVRVCQLEEAGERRDEHAAMAKAFCTSRMRDVVARAREVMGGNGVLAGHHVARFVADAEALYSYEGTREVNTLVVGRAVTGHGAFV